MTLKTYKRMWILRVLFLSFLQYPSFISKFHYS